MSDKALNEIDTSDVADVTLIDQHHGDTLSGSLIGATKEGGELKIWVDAEMD